MWKHTHTFVTLVSAHVYTVFYRRYEVKKITHIHVVIRIVFMLG